jgi:hypothetical protein
MQLNNGLFGENRVVLGFFGHMHEAPGFKRSPLIFFQLRPHANNERPRDHSEIFVGGMSMGRDLVARVFSRMTYGPSLLGSPDKTEICAPFGNAGGAAPHFIVSGDDAT